jgi:hypothetical protein
MKTSKKFYAVAMACVIAASMSVPAFAGASHVRKLNPYSGSSLAANDANATREAMSAYWNAYVQAVGGKEAAAAAVEALTPKTQGIKLAQNTTESRIANSKAAAAQANNTIELAKEELAGNTVVVAPVVTSADLAAIANATYEATHGAN